MDNQDTFNKWLAQDFILDEIERNSDLNDKLVNLYDYFKLQSGYEDDIENE